MHRWIFFSLFAACAVEETETVTADATAIGFAPFEARAECSPGFELESFACEIWPADSDVEMLPPDLDVDAATCRAQLRGTKAGRVKTIVVCS